MYSDVWDDIGYGPHKETHMKLSIEKIKIEYIRGLSKGQIVVMRKDFAEDLIKRQYAIQLEEQTTYRIEREE